MGLTTSTKIKFETNSGVLLDARLESPTSEALDYAIFCHCFTCTKQSLAAFRISRNLAEQQIATLRFDFTGLGQSQGDFSNTNFSSMIDDVQAAYEYLDEHFETPSLLIGHSLGGTAALAASALIDADINIVTLASPSRPKHVLHHFGDGVDRLERNESIRFRVAGKNYDMSPQFLDDVRRFEAETTFRAIKHRTLIISATEDTIVSAENALELAEWLGPDTTLREISGADHMFRDRRFTDDVSTQICEWFEQ